ncbi:hypothetical protein [Hyphomonas sp.]|uniref:hypothetical protein n=1 Tax=Hyphomonas sp. TaxID=87 RepID=UPI00391D7364
MKAADLARQRWQYVSPCGVIRDREGVPALYTRGIVSAEDFCVAITVNGHRFDRLSNERWDDLLARVRNDLDARGDAMNIATCIYDPHVEPQEVRQHQPRFQTRQG